MRKNFYSTIVRIVFLSIIISTGFFQAYTKVQATSFYRPVEQFVPVKTDTGFRVIPAPAKTWGYEILAGKKIMVRQLTIPGLTGIHGFRTKADAEKVAALVIKKLSQGIMPPTVDEEELHQLRIYP